MEMVDAAGPTVFDQRRQRTVEEFSHDLERIYPLVIEWRLRVWDSDIRDHGAINGEWPVLVPVGSDG
jgi:hypothetical protein